MTETMFTNGKRRADAVVGLEQQQQQQQPAKTQPKQYILAIDIERTGAAFKHGVWAIGACFGTDDGVVIQNQIFAKKAIDEVDYDDKTWAEFWKNMPGIRENINALAIPDHIRAFHDWLVMIERTYGPFGRRHQKTVKFRLASDNPAYDFGHIMVAFHEHGYDRGVAEMFDDYVPTDDPTEQEAGLTEEERKEAHGFARVAHTHDPRDDAAAIFQLLCGVRHVLKKREALQN